MNASGPGQSPDWGSGGQHPPEAEASLSQSVPKTVSWHIGLESCMGGSTKSQKAGRLKRLEAKIVKKPASYRDYVET